MPTLKDQAVCLRLYDWSETSQIVVLLSAAHGKIAATAKGAKRQNPSALAKFSGGVELLTTGEAVLITKPNTELANLIEWDMTDPHWHIRRDWRAYQYAMYAADLAHHLISDHDPHPVAYEALAALLADLARPGDIQRALLRFQWALVEDLGYRPVLDHDATTGQPLDESTPTLAFSPTAGGLVADAGTTDRWRVRRTTIQLLRAVAAHQPIDKNPPADLERANRLLCSYFRALLDKHLPTMGVLLDSTPNGHASR